MASAAPVQRIGAAVHTPRVDGKQFVAALRPWRRRLFLQQMVSWMGWGISVGLVLASLVLAIARAVPWATALFWATGVGLACILLALGLALWYRPSLAATARVIDKRLALHDRLSTAWEMRTQTAALYNLQRRDALEHLDKHTPARAMPLRARRISLISFGLLVVLFALLLFLPNPMTRVLQQQAAFQARIAQQIASIEHVRTQVAQQTNTSPQLRKQIDQILRELETKLQQSQNETQAQQAIAEAQAKLNTLRDPQGENKVQAQTSAGQSLQGSPNTNAIGQALSSGDPKKLLQALQNLANQVSKMTPAERAKLAQQIENAANLAGQDPQLQAALHQLAKSIAEGNASEISDASNAVEAAAAQDARAQAQANSIDQTAQGLQQVANNLTASSDGSNSVDASQNNQQGQGQGQASTQGQGQGQQGQGNKQGSGSSGTSRQGSGGGKGSTSGSKAGQSEQVFVPGQTGSGSSTESNGGNSNVAQNGTAVPYAQVIKQYNLMAHDAIDNSDIAPNLKDLVHGYFDALSGK